MDLHLADFLVGPRNLVLVLEFCYRAKFYSTGLILQIPSELFCCIFKWFLEKVREVRVIDLALLFPIFVSDCYSVSLSRRHSTYAIPEVEASHRIGGFLGKGQKMPHLNSCICAVIKIPKFRSKSLYCNNSFPWALGQRLLSKIHYSMK